MNKQRLHFPFLLLMYLTLPLPATAQVVDIPDPNLRAAIEEALGKASGAAITTADMARLTGLEARNANISDLTGLEFATNLKTLVFGYGEVGNSNAVNDLSPLADLIQLTQLDLSGNSISDISPVTGLTNLTWLHFWGNSISDISPVAGLTKLTDLYLGNNNLSDISPVAGLTSLTGLWLNSNNISDISAVSGLTNLMDLHLPGNNISDVSPVAGLTHLTDLILWGNSIADISPLAGLTNLARVDLRHNDISDISSLAANTGLGNGDEVVLNDNPLSFSAIKTHVPALQNRGVTVEFDDTTHLNQGEPRRVRMIYFLPNDRPYRDDLVQRMKDGIRNVQTFYAEQMGAHGYGNKTFRVETDSQGEPMVHRVAGQYPDNHYFDYTESTMWAELELVFNRHTNIYLVVIDTVNTTGGSGSSRQGKNGGGAALYGEFGLGLAAHELGHAFGLWHDFRDGSYLMSYGPGSKDQLSACHAEYLSVHPYFNPDTPIEGGQPPTVELISSRTYPADSKSIPGSTQKSAIQMGFIRCSYTLDRPTSETIVQ